MGELAIPRDLSLELLAARGLLVPATPRQLISPGKFNRAEGRARQVDRLNI